MCIIILVSLIPEIVMEERFIIRFKNDMSKTRGASYAEINERIKRI